MKVALFSTMINRPHNKTAQPRAIAKTVSNRSPLHAWFVDRPATLHALATVVMIPWSIYCRFTNGRTGPKRRT
tara:strand:- start:128 stop:346 length:219 start_codon:yes stop_codon:yes gene_type:complete